MSDILKKNTSGLKSICTQFHEGSAQTKLELLNICSLYKQYSVKQTLDYHHCLLFLIAYPENELLYTSAKHALTAFYAKLRKLPKHKKNHLERSGLPYTTTQGVYSFVLVKWLLQTYGEQVSLDLLETGGLHPKEIFRHCLSEMEYDLLANEHLSPLRWLETASGSKKKTELLKFVIQHIDQFQVSEAIKDQMVEHLRLHVKIRSATAQISRGHLHLPFSSVFYHKTGLLKKFDEVELIQKTLPPRKRLNKTETNRLIEVSRSTLFLLSRETDPVTLCDENGIEYYELERGLSIALFSKVPERRLPLESYIGFVMFKNNYPMAYGGAWLFGQKSLLGINIFENYRGGESAYVFCQLLRSYRQRFKANYFEVEPYQFGKNNPEGIKSGAFWFYYRFGFRPVDSALRQLANEEAEKIKSDKKHRTSFSVLKQFTESHLALSFDPKQLPLDASVISQFITQQIAIQFEGDRNKARAWCLHELKINLGIDFEKAGKFDKIGIEKLYAFIALCLKTKNLNLNDKKQLKELILEKGKSEFRYAELCQKINFKKLISSKRLLSNLQY